MGRHTHRVLTDILSPRPSRRGFLQKAAALSTTILWPSSRGEAQAHTEAPYTPVFFTRDEYRLLEQACECLLPEDENGPGAQTLRVVPFIDHQMQTPYGHGARWYMHPPFQSGPPELGYQLPYSPRELYRTALHFLEHYCQKTYQKTFISLSRAQQEDILTLLEHNTLTLGDIPGVVFFEQLRSNTLEGAFSDPLYGGNHRMQGWIMLGFPGARADFMDWINQHGKAYPFGPVSIPIPHTERG
ncbi:gluconate 2-dehydrogenase subunit 3 family protein [Saccharibacter sp. 17.LH.SD]|nr:gluconate 2-dehydrogenase subunit 3 family protein [Saccharibacter sp. 17.LH.SD]